MIAFVPFQAGLDPELGPRLADLAHQAQGGLLRLLVAFAVLAAGWGMSVLVSRLVRTVLHALKVDEAASGLAGGGGAGRLAPSGAAAWAVEWLGIAVTALLALEVLGYHLAASVADRLGEVVPRIVAAAVLFAVGSLLALGLGAVTQRFLESARIRAAKLQGQAVAAVLTGFAVLLALEQLGFAAQFVMAVGIAAVAAAGLALALAFGLGCRELARDFLVEYLRSLEEPKPRRPD